MGQHSAWQDGRRAWQRLNGWHRWPPHTGNDRRLEAGAIAALRDIRLVQGLLADAELVAVRTARADGESWAAIATALGVARQTAWKKWRDVDGSDETT